MLKLIAWVVIGVLALSFFGISLRELVQDPQTVDNFRFLQTLLRDGWTFVTTWIGAIGQILRG
jgi:hypothetical protein